METIPEKTDDRGDSENSTENLIMRGMRLRFEGRLHEAEESFRNAEAMGPSAEAFYQLACVLFQQGRVEEAMEAFKKTLDMDQDHAKAGEIFTHLIKHQHQKGVKLNEEERFTEAEFCFRKLLDVKPLASARLNLGNALFHQDKLDEAISFFLSALELKPDYEEAQNNIDHTLNAINNQGLELHRKGKPGEAIECYRRILRIKEYSAVHINLGLVLQSQNRMEEAMASFQRAVELAPSSSDARYHLGYALHKQFRYDESCGHLEGALELNPGDPDIHDALGCLYFDLHQFDRAESFCRKAIELDPNHASAHFNLSQICLLQGRLVEGWEEYEWRWKVPGNRSASLFKKYPQPLWDGSDLAGRRILVWSEQGIGDELSYTSMVPDLIETGAEVVLECSRRLVPIFRRSFPRVRCLERQASPVTDTDFHIPLISLNRYFRNDLDSFPKRSAYLSAAPEFTQRCREKYRREGKIIVGISWATSKASMFFYTPLSKWREILGIENVRFVDLQYGNHEEELEAVKGETGVEIFHDAEIDPLVDMDGFASQVDAVDLVIAIDNSTVIMAGALGKPVWVMLPPNPRHIQWFLTGESCPWFPSMRLFRQKQPGGWAELLGRVAGELSLFVKNSID